MKEKKFRVHQIKVEKVLEDLINRIVNNLKVKEIILFGSYSWGKPDKNSDLDIVVILNEEGYSKSFNEKIEKKKKVTNLILDIKRKFPLDLLVYTKYEWNRLIESGFSFFKEINENGIRIYERKN